MVKMSSLPRTTARGCRARARGTVYQYCVSEPPIKTAETGRTAKTARATPRARGARVPAVPRTDLPRAGTEDPMCKPRLESSAQVDMTEN